MLKTPTDPKLVEEHMLALIARCDPDKSICPSDVARAVAGGHPDQWGPLMQPVRRIAVRLAVEGRLIVLRKGKPVDPHAFKGAYRLGPARQD